MPCTEIDKIRDALRKKIRQEQLVYLYSISQREHTRNGKASMEKNLSMENDLKAVLKEELGDGLHADVDNSLPEDFKLNEERFSIKHITVNTKTKAVGSGSIKAKWTADHQKANKFIDQMLTMDPKHFTHILLVYINPTRRSISIICIQDVMVMEAVRTMGRKAFLLREGTNNRGVEYSSQMIEYMHSVCYFNIHIENVTLHDALDPINRRQLLIQEKFS